MAKAPSVNRIVREAFANLSPELRSGIDSLLGSLNPFMTEVTAALTNGLTFRENFAGEIRTVDITPEEDWKQFPFASSNWTNYGGSERAFEYRKTFDGVIKTRGSFKWVGGGTPAAGTKISNLNEAMVTGKEETMMILCQSPASVGHVKITPTGLFYESGQVVALSSTGLEWTAQNRNPARWDKPIDVALGRKDKPYLGRPGMVHILRVIQIDDPTKAAFVTCLDWTPIYSSNSRIVKGIRLHKAWGLMPGIKYRVTMLVSPE